MITTLVMTIIDNFRYSIFTILILALVLKANLTGATGCNPQTESFFSSEVDEISLPLKIIDSTTFEVIETALIHKNSTLELGWDFIESHKNHYLYAKIDDLIKNHPWMKDHFQSLSRDMILFQNHFYVKFKISNTEKKDEIEITFNKNRSFVEKRTSFSGLMLSEKIQDSKQKNKIQYPIILRTHDDLSQEMTFSIPYRSNEIIIASIENSHYIEELNHLDIGYMHSHSLFRNNGLQNLLLNEYLSKFKNLKSTSSTLSETNKSVFLSFLLYQLAKKGIIDLNENLGTLQSYSPVELDRLSYNKLKKFSQKILAPYLFSALKKTPYYKSHLKVHFSRISSLQLRYQKNQNNRFTLNISVELKK